VVDDARGADQKVQNKGPVLATAKTDVDSPSDDRRLSLDPRWVAV